MNLTPQTSDTNYPNVDCPYPCKGRPVLKRARGGARVKVRGGKDTSGVQGAEPLDEVSGQSPWSLHFLVTVLDFQVEVEVYARAGFLLFEEWK